jgi:hypothetical protein
MTEPPNGLTELLWHATAADQVYEILKREQCLTPAALKERKDVIAAITRAGAAHEKQVAALLVGGSREYFIVAALFEASYLNRKARKLFETSTVSKRDKTPRPWWKFW